MSATTHGTPASGYGKDLIRLVCFEHIYGYTFPCTHQQGATRMTSTHPAGGATCWPNNVDANRHTNIHGAAYPRTLGARDLILSLSAHATGVAGGDRLGVGGGPGGVSPYGGGTLLAHVSVCPARQDPGWWYHEAKGKGSIPSAATPIYKYIAELEYVA